MVVVSAAFLLGICRISDADVWTHLAHGRALVAARGFPAHEPFTFPSAAMPYYNTEWLFGVALYATYVLGGLSAVIILKAALLAVAAALLWRTAMLVPPGGVDERDVVRSSIATIVVLAALLAMRYRFVERPDVALMVFIAATIYALECFKMHGRRRALYLLVPIAVIWANVHPSLIVAAGPFAAVIVGGIACRSWRRWHSAIEDAPTVGQLRDVGAVGGVVLLASLLNPYGWDAVTLPFRLAGFEWFTHEITELQRPRMVDHPIALALGVLLIITLLLNIRPASIGAVILAAPFAWLALSGVRFVFLFPLVAAPLIVRGLSAALARLRDTRWHTPLTAVASSATAAMIIVTAFAVANAGPLRLADRRPGVGVDARAVPEGALAYLDRIGMQGRLFNAFHFGGYIAWRDVPRRAPIIDGRGWVPHDLIEEIHFARVYPAHLSRLQRAYGFDAAVMDYASFVGEPLDEVLPGADAALNSPEWALVYWDDVALVYLRRTGSLASVAERDEYRYLRPANGAAALSRALVAGAPPDAIAAEIARNARETGSALGRTLGGALALHQRQWDVALERFASVHDGPGRISALQGGARGGWQGRLHGRTRHVRATARRDRRRHGVLLRRRRRAGGRAQPRRDSASRARAAPRPRSGRCLPAAPGGVSPPR